MLSAFRIHIDAGIPRNVLISGNHARLRSAGVEQSPADKDRIILFGLDILILGGIHEYIPADQFLGIFEIPDTGQDYKGLVPPAEGE